MKLRIEVTEEDGFVYSFPIRGGKWLLWLLARLEIR